MCHCDSTWWVLFPSCPWKWHHCRFWAVARPSSPARGHWRWFGCFVSSICRFVTECSISRFWTGLLKPQGRECSCTSFSTWPLSEMTCWDFGPMYLYSQFSSGCKIPVLAVVIGFLILHTWIRMTSWVSCSAFCPDSEAARRLARGSSQEAQFWAWRSWTWVKALRTSRKCLAICRARLPRAGSFRNTLPCGSTARMCSCGGWSCSFWWRNRYTVQGQDSHLLMSSLQISYSCQC